MEFSNFKQVDNDVLFNRLSYYTHPAAVVFNNPVILL